MKVYKMMPANKRQIPTVNNGVNNNYCKTSANDDCTQTILHVTMLTYSVGYRIIFQKGKVAEA